MIYGYGILWMASSFWNHPFRMAHALLLLARQQRQRPITFASYDASSVSVVSTFFSFTSSCSCSSLDGVAGHIRKSDRWERAGRRRSALVGLGLGVQGDPGGDCGTSRRESSNDDQRRRGGNTKRTLRPSWCAHRRRTTTTTSFLTGTTSNYDHLNHNNKDEDEDDEDDEEEYVGGHARTTAIQGHVLIRGLGGFPSAPRNTTVSIATDASIPTTIESSQNKGSNRTGRRRQQQEPKTTLPNEHSMRQKKKKKNPMFLERAGRGIVEQDAQRTRLLNNRFYARKDSFDSLNLYRRPGLSDLSLASESSSSTSSLSRFLGTFWITLPARLLTFAVAYVAFPYILALSDKFVTMDPDQLDDITSKFGPGIAILYGTFTSLTISILYQRQKSIQESAALEASLLVLVLHSLVSLFHNDPTRTIQAAQAVVDQVRTMVKSSRGMEMMQIMYTDPYSRMLELVNEYEQNQPTADQQARQANLASDCRDIVRELTKTRSVRLAEEARALPPTHFLILNVLTSFILLAYSINTLPVFDRVGGEPPSESTLIFGLLTSVYVLFYNFADDLNNPFEGVYQIRRSTTATHLLQIKWFLVNHPLLCDQINFCEEPNMEMEDNNDIDGEDIATRGTIAFVGNTATTTTTGRRNGSHRDKTGITTMHYHHHRHRDTWIH